MSFARGVEMLEPGRVAPERLAIEFERQGMRSRRLAPPEERKRLEVRNREDAAKPMELPWGEGWRRR
jgi:hypothetical protein